MEFKYLVLMLAASVLCGCGSRVKSADEAVEGGFKVDGDIVTVDGTSPVAGKLILEKVEREELGSGFITTASVNPRPDAYAEVGLPFGGRVTRTLVRLGDKVHRGQALYEIASADYMEAVKEYVENNNAASVATSDLRRKKALHESGIVSDKELEEAESACSDAAAALALSRQVLSIFGTDPSSVKVGQPLRVISPISGTVVKAYAPYVEGEGEEDEAPVAVADLSSVWVTANVKDNLVSGIAKGQAVDIEYGGQTIVTGKVCYVGEILDEKTRTVPVMVECSNQDRALKPGMFVSARFSGTAREALAIPAKAVFQGPSSKFVYVCQEGMTFRKTPVEVENLEEGRMLVSSGLEGGETIIAEGGIYLSR